MKPSNPVLQHHYVLRVRDFVTDPSSNITHAVFVSAISCDQLSDEVTERWLSKPCPDRRLSPDDEDLNKIIAALPCPMRQRPKRVPVYPNVPGPLNYLAASHPDVPCSCDRHSVVACAAGGAGACAQADPRQRDCARADQYADDRALREPQGSGLVNDGTEVRGAVPRGRWGKPTDIGSASLRASQ
jgi:hypothetical protein